MSLNSQFVLNPLVEPTTRSRESASPARTRWLNVVSHLDPRYGGLSAVVPQLGSMIAASGDVQVGLAAFCAPGELYAPGCQSTLDLTYWPTSRLLWLRDRALREQFRSEINKADGLHIHGLWEQSTASASYAARAARKPYVLSAHGMLDPWALSMKKWKKRLYSTLLERANVRGASCLHALTRAEALDYRRYGSRQPIAVIPNGVHVPKSVTADLFLNQYPLLRHRRVILFLGRLHPKKGLDILLESWRSLSKEWPEAHLVLAGPDFGGTRLSLERAVQHDKLLNSVTFTGMLRNEIKWSALAAAECFVLPSYSEGLSVAVLEAMGVGLPVVITEECNIPEVEQLGAGWIVRSNTGSLKSALNEVLSNSYSRNRAIGDKGRAYIASRYNWKVVAAQMADLYQWILGGSQPQTFEFLMDQNL